MKILIAFSTLLFSINLIGMESPSKSIIKKNKYYQNIMNSFNQPDPLNFDKECDLFNKAVDSRDSDEAYKILKEILENDIHFPNHRMFDDMQTILMNFVLGFIGCINIEKLMHKHENNILEEKFSSLYTKYLDLTNALSEYKMEHNIDLDQINISTCNGFNSCLITLAIKLSASIQILNFLLEEGITFNKADINGNTPLHILAALPEDNSTLAIAKCLIRYKIDIHAINTRNLKPRIIAAQHNNISLAKILMKAREYYREDADYLRRLAIHNCMHRK